MFWITKKQFTDLTDACYPNVVIITNVMMRTRNSSYFETNRHFLLGKNQKAFKSECSSLMKENVFLKLRLGRVLMNILVTAHKMATVQNNIGTK